MESHLRLGVMIWAVAAAERPARMAGLLPVCRSGLVSSQTVTVTAGAAAGLADLVGQNKSEQLEPLRSGSLTQIRAGRSGLSGIQVMIMSLSGSSSSTSSNLT